MKRRDRTEWRAFKRVIGEVYDRMVYMCKNEKTKGKVYKMVVRPALLYGPETTELTKRQEAELEVVKLKILRCSLRLKGRT